MINAIAIDDEPRALEIIKNHAARIPFLSLKGSFTNPFEALAYLQAHTIDLVFLDISMPDISGLEFVKAVNQKKLSVVFTTAHSEYALESYELEALDYLLKPFEFSRFLKSVMKAQERLSQPELPEQDFFFVNTGYQQRKLRFDEISHIEAGGNYVTYYTNGDKVLVRSTIKETLRILPASQFIQVHKSYIISLQKLDIVQDNHLHLGAHKISIGASYREELMKVIGLLGR